MDSPNWVIIAILSIIVNIVFLILYFTDFVDTIRSLLRRSYRWLKRSPIMFRERRWWKEYCPSWEIVSVGKLEITKTPSQYHMELQIDVRYKSRDCDYPTRMDCTQIRLDVFNLVTGRDRTPYKLHSDPSIWRIEPLSDEGGYLRIAPSWELPCNEEWVIRFTFIGDEVREPRLGKSTDCKVMAMGKPHIERVPIIRELRGLGRKFQVNVNKQYEE